MKRLMPCSLRSVAILLPFQAIVVAGPDAERILRDAVAAHGGLDRFRAVRDWHIVADRRLEGEASIEIYEEFLLRDGVAEKTLLVKKREGSVLVFGHDGGTGFALENGRTRDDEGASGEGYYRAHGEYYLRALPFKWMDPGVHLEYAGREMKEGRDLDVLRITAGENVGKAWKDVWVAAFDRGTHLLWEARLTHHRENETWMNPRATGTTEITYRYTDYREVKGLRVPHQLEYFSEGRRTGENAIRTMRIDVGLTEETFVPDTHRDGVSHPRSHRPNDGRDSDS